MQSHSLHAVGCVAVYKTLNMDIHLDTHAGPAVGNDRLVIAQAAYIKATPCDRGCCGGLCCVGVQIPEIIAHACNISLFLNDINFVTVTYFC